MLEDTAGLLRGVVLQDVADSFGEPFWVQNYEVSQALVVAVVNDLAKIMHQLGNCVDLVIIDMVALADFDESRIGHQWFSLGTRENLIASGNPSRTDQLTHLR